MKVLHEKDREPFLGYLGEVTILVRCGGSDVEDHSEPRAGWIEGEGTSLRLRKLWVRDRMAWALQSFMY